MSPIVITKGIYMARKASTLARLMAGASFVLMASAGCGAAYAAEALATATPTTVGTEGSSASEVIITAEQGKAAANAPSKANIQEFQPESIISRQFIEQAVPETGSWMAAAAIAPGVSGITSNGGGVGETAKLSMRGFQDGQFNVTYDGIAFGDTNGPTHHQASYWPASTIGSVVWDRGPGAAGDLGQANFGGALHMFSADPSHTMGAQQKFTVGSFDTVAAVTTLNTGDISQLFGGRLLINLDERNSNGELSFSGGEAQNQLAKFVMPIGDKWTLTLFGSHNYTRFYQADAGPGETWSQVAAYGKNFALNDNSQDEHYYKYNQQTKQTDFEYADIKGEVRSDLTVEDQLYSYFYTNKTYAANSTADPQQGLPVNQAVFQPVPASPLGSGPDVPQTPNTLSLINTVTGPEKASDIGGYYKLNQYRVYGDIVRVNKSFGDFATLKAGGVYEWSGTDRANELEDFTLGGPTTEFPDFKYTTKKYTNLSANTNDKTLENSAYQTWQLFADLELHPIQNLTIMPGVKYIHSDIQVNAADDTVVGGSTATALKNVPLVASTSLASPVYFITANYRVRPDLAVYFQAATSFQLPGLPDLYNQAANVEALQPERTTTYQGGIVYNHGNITADADVYRIDASNLQVNCTITVGGSPDTGTCNAGNARYTGAEGEAAYHFDFGVTLFANGALISAKQLANTANAGAQLAANPAETLTNAPKWTDAIGAIYRNGQLSGSLTYKQSGAYVAGYLTGSNQAINLPGYDTFDASLGYDFGKFTLKAQVFNLLDHRAITSYTCTTVSPTSQCVASSAIGALNDIALYSFQAGREIQFTASAKF